MYQCKQCKHQMEMKLTFKPQTQREDLTSLFQKTSTCHALNTTHVQTHHPSAAGVSQCHDPRRTLRFLLYRSITPQADFYSTHSPASHTLHICVLLVLMPPSVSEFMFQEHLAFTSGWFQAMGEFPSNHQISVFTECLWGRFPTQTYKHKTFVVNQDRCCKCITVNVCSQRFDLKAPLQSTTISEVPHSQCLKLETRKMHIFIIKITERDGF